MYLTYVATVTLHFIFGVLRALILKTSNKTQLLEFFFRQLFPLEKKKNPPKWKCLSLLFLQRTLQTLSHLWGQAQVCEELRHVLTHLSRQSLPPKQSRSSIRHAPQGPPVLVLFLVTRPTCPQQKPWAFLHLPSAWHCGNLATDSSLEGSQAGEHPCPAAGSSARRRASSQLRLHC